MELRKFENYKNNDAIRNHKHINSDRLCYCCDTLQDKKESLHSYNVNDNYIIQLCDDCSKLVKHEWIESNECDDEILSFVKTFPVENQEYMLNGLDFYHMERQDWIDMTNGDWSDEMYKEYGIYSPRQTEAYIKRFPICQHPINVEYENSKGCCCVFGAVGKFGQQIRSETDISDTCYKCSYYKKRDEPIKTMTSEQFNIYSAYYIGKINYLKYKDIFEN